jgi:hypothetical protein
MEVHGVKPLSGTCLPTWNAGFLFGSLGYKSASMCGLIYKTPGKGQDFAMCR